MTITLQLFPEVAPITVENFLKLIEDNFYEEIIMHRIIEGFMIQGGDPAGTGASGSDEKIIGEFKANGVDNSLSHVRGVISMARKPTDLNSASSQFFIVHQDSEFLNGNYAAFGMVIDGFDTLDSIATVETTNDKPVSDITITSITIKK
ncbi:peptidylprolyl isomerase [Mycoplasmatota bacterium]|nr:peptidylprolyl isomerase [Mycoplasmatota bacterium]